MMVTFILMMWPVWVVTRQFGGINVSSLWTYWTEAFSIVVSPQRVKPLFQLFLSFVVIGLVTVVGSLIAQPFRFHRWVQSRQRRAMKKYGDRWLGLWSKHDEAINSLTITPRLGESGQEVLPRISRRIQPDESEALAKIAKASPLANSPAGALTQARPTR